MRKSVASCYYLLTSAFSGFASGRLAGAFRAGTFSCVPQMASGWVRGHQNFGGVQGNVTNFVMGLALPLRF